MCTSRPAGGSHTQFSSGNRKKQKINGTKLCYHLPIVVYRLQRFLADGGVYRANLQPVSVVGALAPSSTPRVHSAVDPVKTFKKN